MLIHELKMKCKSVNMRLDGGLVWGLAVANCAVAVDTCHGGEKGLSSGYN